MNEKIEGSNTQSKADSADCHMPANEHQGKGEISLEMRRIIDESLARHRTTLDKLAKI